MVSIKRQIKGISVKLTYDLFTEIPHLGTVEHQIGDNLCNIILNDSVIIKVYDDCVVFDLGGKKEFLLAEDFISLEVC